MSLAPYERIADPTNAWNVAPYSGWNRRDLMDPFAGLSRDLVTPNLAPALARSRETVNVFSPLLAADLIETENDFHVHVDMPGIAPEDLQVTVDNGFLELAAERKQIHQESNIWANKIERSFGRVSRRLMLPAQADQDSADCTFRNGVLTVSFRRLGGSGSARQLLIK